MSPLDYTRCRQTVTVYRRQEDKVLRQVLDNCFLQMKDTLREDVYGKECSASFLLIVPGTQQMVFPGDRILEGIGPEVTDWGQTSGFAQTQYAQVFCWDGEICHTEAGRKGLVNNA